MIMYLVVAQDKMIISNKKWQELLIEHKKLISYMDVRIDRQQKVDHLLKQLDEQALKLCLFYANFKCQYKKCKENKQLTIHHLINRIIKDFVDDNRYFSLRYYWNNQVILCPYHHSMIDKVSDEMGIIDEKKVEEIKKYFGEKR